MVEYGSARNVSHAITVSVDSEDKFLGTHLAIALVRSSDPLTTIVAGYSYSSAICYRRRYSNRN